MHIWDDRFGYRTFRYKKYAYVKNRAGTYVSLYGDKLKRIHKWDKDQPELFESDVNPEIRVLVDHYTDSDEVSEGHRTMIFDIEVEVTDGFPDVRRANNKITSIAFYDSILDKYYCYVLDPLSKLETDVKRANGDIIVSFKDEYDLLNAFFKKYMEIQPTILTGWNIEFFDISYLYNRATQIVSQSVANLLSPIGQVHWSDFHNRYKIAGVNVLDYLALYKKYTFSQRPSYRLDAIGEYEVGEKKISYEGTLNDLYDNDINKFVEYNLQDVKLIDKLENFILNYWSGKEKLWKAFWLIGIVGRIFVAFFIVIFSLIGKSIGLTWSVAILSVLFVLIYIILAFVSIWRCAFNTQNNNWGYVARIFISMDLFVGIYQAINVLKNNSLTN